MKVLPINLDITCQNCQEERHGYRLTDQPKDVPQWLCIDCFLNYLQEGILQVEPHKTVIGAGRHYLKKSKLAYCHTCAGMCDLKLDDESICQNCFIKATTDGDLVIVTLNTAPDVAVEAEAPFEVAWE